MANNGKEWLIQYIYGVTMYVLSYFRNQLSFHFMTVDMNESHQQGTITINNFLADALKN